MKIIAIRYSDDTISSRPGLANYNPVFNSVKEEDVVYNTVSGLKTDYAVFYQLWQSTMSIGYNPVIPHGRG